MSLEYFFFLLSVETMNENEKKVVAATMAKEMLKEWKFSLKWSEHSEMRERTCVCAAAAADVMFFFYLFASVLFAFILSMLPSSYGSFWAICACTKHTHTISGSFTFTQIHMYITFIRKYANIAIRTNTNMSHHWIFIATTDRNSLWTSCIRVNFYRACA